MHNKPTPQAVDACSLKIGIRGRYMGVTDILIELWVNMTKGIGGLT